MDKLIKSINTIGENSLHFFHKPATDTVAMNLPTLLILRLFIVCIIASVFSLPTSNLYAENQQKQQKKLQRQINSATTTLKNARATSYKLHRDVLSAEKKLSDASRQLHSTEQKINKLATKLNKSNALRQKLQQQTEQEKNALSQQMQALYTSGKQSHLRLLLKQDDPSDISRTVKYFEYLNLHRVKRISKIKTRLEKIQTVQLQINEDTQALTNLQKQQGNAKKELKHAVAAREKSYKHQRRTVTTNKQALNKLKTQESRLQGVIARLAAKQAKADKKRKQREKLAKLEKQRAKKEKAKAKNKKLKKAKKKRILATPHYVPNKAFSSLKGKLSWPVRGRITKTYGSSRNSKQKWKGVIISAAGGSKVRAVARGKVEFSGRLNGYGYLIIIRHDNNYRSLYAYNRSVYKKQGQIVNLGDTIAAVGNSGGRSQNGLYFEIRKGTSYRNPAHWCR